MFFLLLLYFGLWSLINEQLNRLFLCQENIFGYCKPENVDKKKGFGQDNDKHYKEFYNKFLSEKKITYYFPEKISFSFYKLQIMKECQYFLNHGKWFL